MDVKRRATFSSSPFPRHPSPGQSLRSRTLTDPIDQYLCGRRGQKLGLRPRPHQGLPRPDVGEAAPRMKGWPEKMPGRLSRRCMARTAATRWPAIPGSLAVRR